MGTFLIFIGILAGAILMIFGVSIFSSTKGEEKVGFATTFIIVGIAIMIAGTYCGENLKFSYPIESVTAYWSEHDEVLYKVEYTLRADTHMVAIMTEEQFKDFKDGKKIKLSLHDEEEIMIKRAEDF